MRFLSVTGLGIPTWMVLDDGTATAIGIAIGLLIISALVALWLRSCRNHQHRASAAAAGGSTNSGQPGFRSRFCFSSELIILKL